MASGDTWTPIMAALIGAAATLGAAWIALSGGRGVAPPAAVAPAAGGRAIRIDNDCDRAIDIRLYYQAASGWTAIDGGVWTFDPGEARYPVAHDERLRAIGPDIYFRADTIDGASHWAGPYGVIVAGRRIGMMRARLARDGEDDVLRLVCPIDRAPSPPIRPPATQTPMKDRR